MTTTDQLAAALNLAKHLLIRHCTGLVTGDFIVIEQALAAYRESVKGKE